MSQNNTSILYAGVDIAKQSLQLDWDGQSHQLTNDPKGFAKLQKLLGKPGHCQVILEATGGYERALAASLHEAGYALSIIMPRRVRAYAEADAQLAKTDAIDAKMLRLFGQAIRPKPTPAPTAQQRRLQELALRRSQLVEAKTALLNQAEHYEDAWTKRQARTQLGQLEGFIAKCEEQIAKLLAADERLAARSKRMQQVPGVGPITAAVLEAYLPELGTIDSNPAAALAGLAPYPDQSGPRNGPRFIRGGRKPVRCALFMAAMSTIKHDAIFKAFYTRLRAAGKKPMVALTAVMRKLLVLLNRLLSNPSFQLHSHKA